jgi:Mlc titration factor MtfA (ptsG expression regulator)
VPFYARAGADVRAHFERDVRIALAELRFEGAGEVEVTDELRLSVAAGVALLLHGRPDWELPRGRTVLFYAGSFDDQYDVDDRPEFDGMVHPQGPVILSVPAVQMGWARADGYNVVLHELAHLFDFQAAGADGLPSLLASGSAGAWMQLVREEMRKARTGRSVLSGYAATAPAELFAVATEQFFERPARLRRHHPELFDAMVAFYRFDPTPPDGEDERPEEERASLMARRWEEEGGE